jgi:hypothetical protein
LFPTIQVPFPGSFAWLFSWPNWLPFYTLDPWFLATTFLASARHSTTLKCMRLTDHVTLNFNNKMSTATVFLYIEKAFDTTRHSGLLYKLSKLKFSTSLIKLIGSFLSNRKFSVSVEGEMSTPEKCKPGWHGPF